MTLSTMYGQVSQRLNEAAAPTFYPTLEIVAAINEASRLFCLLTLALETTVNWAIPDATTFTHMLGVYADFIVPLRIATAAGSKIRPARLSELWSLDSQWVASPGLPVRYTFSGADLIGVYKQPFGSGNTVALTYAQSPAALVGDGDVPATPPEFHPLYVKYAIYRCRQAEGGEALASVLPLLADFMDGATEYAAFVRARNIGAGYDALPMELALFDRSRLVGEKKKR